ncbi:hypothetical protein BT63DRAFT_419654 [Microthyrium microscopicum]|uniref:Uncharacterized protein n=1 Tax=Microthyrium microscopicum TaxID=703497 RepID=A0A6A6UPZ3_9PEZI|nr:hypothetical protein BT63DRAFT_419654 [Microthyrium microscopicum]
MSEQGDFLAPNSPFDGSQPFAPTQANSPPVQPTALQLPKGHHYPIVNITTPPPPISNAEKWRVPTILVLTISVVLGIGMVMFLMWVAYRKVKQLRQLRRQEEMSQRA